MMDFAMDENLFLKYFARAWHMATENGMDHLVSINEDEREEIM